MSLPSINGIDAECYLRYNDFLYSQRHWDLSQWGNDAYKGPKHSTLPVTAAHYELNNAAACANSEHARAHGISLGYSRGQKGVPDTRHMLSCFVEQGLVLPRHGDDRNGEFEIVNSTPDTVARLDAFLKIAQAAIYYANFRTQSPAELADFVIDILRGPTV